jgi:transcriptional regulator with XRE-family HTH domain
MEKIGDIIKELRTESKISQSAFAKAIGVGQATVCEWEKGVYEPTASAIRAIAKFFNVSADYLLQIEN